MVQNSNKKYNIFICLLYFTIPIMFYFNGVLTNHFILPFSNGDFMAGFAMIRNFSKNILSGTFPQWNPYLAAGMPQIAISGMYLPAMLLSFFPEKVFIYSFYWLHMFIGGLGLYLYLREKKCNPSVAMIFGIIFEISIQLNGVRRGHPTIIAAVSLFPFIMYCSLKYVNTCKIKWLCFAASLAALQTAAFLQYGCYAQIILFVYLLYNVISKGISIKKIIFSIFIYLVFYIGSLSALLLPDLSVIQEYRSFGSSPTDFQTFSSWSMHPVKILMQLYPFIFKDVYQAFGNMNSSEMDIEIYFGTAIFLLFILAILLYKRIKTSKIEIICLCVAFCITCIAHIPILNKFVFHIPVLNGFRCSGRALYLYNFFYLSLSASTLQNLLYADDDKRISNKLKRVSLSIFCLSLFASLIILAYTRAYGTCGLRESFYHVKHVFIRPILVSSAFFIFVWTMQNKKLLEKFFNNEKVRENSLLILLLCFSAAEILPFSVIHHPKQVETTKREDFYGVLQNDFAYKIWDAFSSVSGEHNSLISQNQNINLNISAINSYTAFNNPNLCKYFKNLSQDIHNIPFNSSGMNTGSFNAHNIILFNNDMLSMLGVKYIIDSSNIIRETDGEIFEISDAKKILLNGKDFNISSYNGNVGVFAISENLIEADTIYEIEFDVEKSDREKLNYFAVDLYGGPEYDFAQQEAAFRLNSRKSNHFKATIYSGDTTKASIPPVMRFLAVSNFKQEFYIKNLYISASKTTKQKVYEYLRNDSNDVAVYINKNAKPLIYTPEQIRSTNNWDDLYLSHGEYELDKYAYLLSNTKEKHLHSVTVNNLNLHANSVSARIQSSGDSYICFSQCYSKYWKVKIDGKKQKVDFVNGLIMGTHVPSGEYDVVFYYSNYTYMLGIAISLINFFILLIICIEPKCFLFKRFTKKTNSQITQETPQ